jgi:hypothetical protein
MIAKEFHQTSKLSEVWEMDTPAEQWRRARIVLSGNINTCVVYEQHRVPSTPLLD